MLSVLSLIPLNAKAQVFIIGQDSITACAGGLYDDGGPNFPYSNNESLVSVICPDLPGQMVALDFVNFDLAPGAIPPDRLRIHDGPNTSAPLLGEYYEQDLLGLIVMPSLLNATGCLTLAFHSNAAETGDFVASISCIAQCQQPIASFTTMGDTIFLCEDEVLPVDASASTAIGAQGIAAWAWISSLPGLSATAGGALDTLSFALSGIHRIRLQVIDSTGCGSELTEPLIVVVRPSASFVGTLALSPAACLNDTVTLIGSAALDSLLFQQAPAAVYEDGLFLPDDVGVPLSSSIHLWSFPEDAMINEASEIGNICVSMEHSHMGDLVIMLTCPNGATAVLHQQGGGGTYIGGANDGDSNANPVLGSCWQYCWSDDALLGTFAECAAFGPTPNVMPGGTPPNNVLIPGTYSPVQPISNLIGCPMNGTWTFTFYDLWGADNGFLCSWSLGLAPQTDSSLVGYSATIDLGNPDSAYWSGPGLLPPASAAQSIALPGGQGEFPYTLTVIDSEGCVHDTTLTVTVVDSPFLVDAGPDVSLCDGPTTLEGTVFNSADTCTYTLLLFESFGDGWGGGANLAVSIAGNTVTYSITGFGVLSDTISLPVSAGDAIILNYTAGTIWNNENSFRLLNSAGVVIYQSPQGPVTGIVHQSLASCAGSPATPFITWSPTLGLADPYSAVTSVSPPAAGWYVLTVSLAGGACMASDSVLVDGSTSMATLAYNASSNLLCMEPAAFVSYHWFLAGNLYATTPGNCLVNPQYGIWTAIGQTTDTCDAYAQAIAICPSIGLAYANGILSTQAGLGEYNWTFNGSPLPNAVGPVITPAGVGEYTVTITMDGGCVISASIVIDSLIGVDEQIAGRSPLRIVPNPNRGDFVLGLPETLHGTLRVIVLDATGRLVDERNLNTATGLRSMPLSLSLAPGAYSIGVRNAEKQFFTRLTLE